MLLRGLRVSVVNFLFPMHADGRIGGFVPKNQRDQTSVPTVPAGVS
jgi:hypothetical protein